MEDTKIIEEELQHYDVVDDDEDWDYDEDFDDEEFDIDVDVDDYDEEEDLDHSGIKGMKWGVRRFQNADGSLTPAGRKRYGSLTDAVGAVKAYHIKQKRKKNLAKAREAAAEKKRIEAEQKAAVEQRKKDVESGKVSARNMTAEELQSRIDKLNLEKRYKQLMDETNPSAQTVSAGKSVVKKIINEAVVPAAVSAGKAALTEKLTEQAKKQLGLTDNDLSVLKKEADTWDLKQKISNAKKTIHDNDKKMNGEEDESARLEKEAKDAQNRWKIEQFTNKLAGEKGYTSDNSGTAADKMRTKEEAQKKVDEYNESGYGQDTVTPEVSYPKSTKIANPPAVYEKAVTSLSNVATDSKEYANLAYKGEQVVADAILDRDGNIITKIKHSGLLSEDILNMKLSDEELQHWGIKGMKWGQRRFQNKDGSLTPEGKKRYSDEDDDKTDYKDTAKNTKSVVDASATREGKLLSKLTGKTVIPIDDKDDFVWDVEGTDEKHYGERLSSTNPDDVKRISEELTSYWKDVVKNADKSYRDSDNTARVKEYPKTYMKDIESYTKAVLDEVNYWRDQRGENQRLQKVDEINAKYKAKYDDAVSKGIRNEDIELIELEWMEELDKYE